MKLITTYLFSNYPRWAALGGYAQQGEVIVPGKNARSGDLSLEEFKGLFPNATFAERREMGPAKMDAYSVRVEEKFRYRDESYGYMARDEKWFYFRDGVFVKWSGPDQWPEGAGDAK